MKRGIIILLVVCLACPMVKADDVRKPEFQIADNSFFDPTKKDNKVEKYTFGVEYRVEGGFVQHHQRTRDLSFPDMYLHGVRVGATFTFKLPLHFGLQTGVLYTVLYGRNQQHWRSMDAPTVQTEYIQHRVVEHDLTIPVRAYYTVPLWKELNLFFYGGPQLQIGLAENDYMELHLSEGTKAWLETQGIPVEPYDRMNSELWRANIQIGVGGGLEWANYRLQSGYDFGLNNMVRNKQNNQYMAEWGWMVTFSYRFK